MKKLWPIKAGWLQLAGSLWIGAYLTLYDSSVTHSPQLEYQ